MLEWTYTPTDFFEEEDAGWSTDRYQISLTEGKALASFEPEVFQSQPSLEQEIQNRLVNRFLANQLFVSRRFTLSAQPDVVTSGPNGERGVTIRVAAAAIAVSSASADVIIKDKDGRVISDTKQERLDRKRHLASLTTQHEPTDPTLSAILRSYQAAINDPDNFLVHLYEIRDALKKRFGKEKIAIDSIDISNNRWEDLGILASTRPLRQGRHRGSHAGNLRNATKEETDKAYAITREMIEKYLVYLDKHQNTSHL